MSGDDARDDSSPAPNGSGTHGRAGGDPESAPDRWQGEPSLIDFPATIDVKAMGLAANDFESLVGDLVLPHVPEPGPESITRRESSGGKYLSVRVRFVATSKNQLEAIYAALHAEPRVLFTL